MVLFLILCVIMGLITYIWSSRGFFSSLINMVVTIIAAVIALSIWEPLAYWLMGQLSDQWMLDGVWGAALVFPFIIILGGLSIGVNAVLRANVKISGVADTVGGALCGLVAAFICTGIVFQSASMIRAKVDSIGPALVEREKTGGSPIRASGMLIPIDRIWANTMLALSRTTMASGTPMASYRPQFGDEPHLLRLSPDDMFLKYSYKPGDVRVAGRFTVGKDQQLSTKDLVGDSKAVKNIDGENASGQSYVEGYLVQFAAGARETGGQVVVGPGMVTLVMRHRQSDTPLALQPFAMVSQAKGDSLDFGRWRFDSPDLYVASAGAGSDPVMAFEFLAPRGDWVPIALYVKGIRQDLLDESTSPAKEMAPAKAFTSSAEYLATIGSGTIRGLASGGVGGALINDGTGRLDTNKLEDSELPIRASNFIGDRFNKSLMDGLEMDGKKQVTDGDATLAAEAILGVGTDKSLIVESFSAGDGSIIVQVDGGPKSAWYLRADKSEGATGAPKLQDDKGQTYECIGWYFRRGSDIRIRFTPGKPIADKSELPSISKTDDTVRFSMIFRVSLGTSMSKYLIGNTVIGELVPPKLYEVSQKPR